MYIRKTENMIRCPLEYGMQVFGGKWKPRIICVLSVNKRMRYNEIRENMVDITDTVLTNTLKELCRDNLVVRRAYNEIPPRVEYELTEGGISAIPILQQICAWSDIKFVNEEDKMLPQCRHCDYGFKNIT